jgi:hypothetical protein
MWTEGDAQVVAGIAVHPVHLVANVEAHAEGTAEELETNAGEE